jgi:hypothetical protein
MESSLTFRNSMEGNGMRSTVCVLLVAASLGAVGFGMQVVSAQSSDSPQVNKLPEPSDGLIALSFPGEEGNGAHMVAVVDPETRVMSVYHIDRASGGISLKSVRSVHWDLQMEEFNGARPTPNEIRSLIQRR